MSYSIERVMKWVSPEPNTGCWLWDGYVDKDGYGQFGVWNGSKVKNYRAHRFMYEAHNGPIPVGMFVCHRCDTPGCVNPDHLWVGTAADNSRDRNSKNRHAYGERNGNAKLTEAEVAAIRADTRRHAVIAKAFNTSMANVSIIRAGKTRNSSGVAA